MFGHRTLLLIFTHILHLTLAAPSSNLDHKVLPRDPTAPTNPTGLEMVRAGMLPRGETAIHPRDRALPDRYQCNFVAPAAATDIKGAAGKFDVRSDCNTGPGCETLAVYGTAMIEICGGYRSGCQRVSRILRMFPKSCLTLDGKSGGIFGLRAKYGR